MLVIPAIDLKDGECVRLKRGDFSEKTVYSQRPLEVACAFRDKGAKRLHVVDLDGAESGEGGNQAIIQSLIDGIDIPIQLGGGLRSLALMQAWLEKGMDSLIVGTLAIEQPELFVQAMQKFGPERLILAVDAKNGKVMSAGWQKESAYTAAQLALKFKSYGLQRLLYTDILRDGMGLGPNVEATKDLAQKTGLKVTASGGVGSLDDLVKLRQLSAFGVDSVVVGRAFYENQLNLEEAFSC